jgi:epoxide hydrolase
LAFALMDSPVGLLAWNAQLLGEDLDAGFVLTNVMVYWLTETAASAARLYYENAHRPPPTEPTRVPVGLAAFGGDFSGIRRFAERDHENIVHWSVFDRGGHFAAHEAPTCSCPMCASSSEHSGEAGIRQPSSPRSQGGEVEWLATL